MKFSEIKELSEAELQKKHRELGDELFICRSGKPASRKTSSPQEHKTTVPAFAPSSSQAKLNTF